MSRARDAALALAAIVLGLAWWWKAAQIEDSLLSDAVGAGGVPKALAALMAGAGALLLLRTLWRAPPEEEPRPPGAHLKAVGLVALILSYILAAPIIGYVPAIALFAVAAAAYAGARLSPALAGFGIGLAAFFWVAFVKLLGIPFPTGALFGS
jgi:putative tricarboxylic transport membrane protein